MGVGFTDKNIVKRTVPQYR